MSPSEFTLLEGCGISPPATTVLFYHHILLLNVNRVISVSPCRPSKRINSCVKYSGYLRPFSYGLVQKFVEFEHSNILQTIVILVNSCIITTLQRPMTEVQLYHVHAFHPSRSVNIHFLPSLADYIALENLRIFKL